MINRDTSIGFLFFFCRFTSHVIEKILDEKGVIISYGLSLLFAPSQNTEKGDYSINNYRETNVLFNYRKEEN